jgi:MFS family permease
VDWLSPIASLLKATSALLYVTYFFYTSSLGVVFVFLEDVQRRNDLSDWELGMVAAAGFAVALVVQLLLSPFADRGRSLFLALTALTCGVLGPIGFAYGSSALVVALSRGLSGVGLGLFAILARKALIGLDAAGGGAKLGMLLSSAVAGFIIGPVIGALFEPLGFEAPFVLVSAAILVFGSLSIRVIMRTEIAASPVGHGVLGDLVRRPRIQAALLVQVIVMGYIGVFDAIVDRYLTELGAGTGQVALVIVAVGFPLLILPRIAGNRAEALGGARVMLPALILLIPVMLGYSAATSVVMFTLFGFLHGSAESFATVSSQVLVLEVTKAERAAVGTSLVDAAGLTSAAVTAGLAPPVYGAIGRGLFVGSAAIAFGLALLAWQRARAGAELDYLAVVAQTR